MNHVTIWSTAPNPDLITVEKRYNRIISNNIYTSPESL
jgi:hypothetical protein